MTEASGGNGQVSNQPRGIGDILSEAFDLYKKNAVLLIVTAAVAMGPIYALKDAFMAVALVPIAGAGLERDEARLKDLEKELRDAQARGASPAEMQAITSRQMEVALGSAGRAGGLLAGIGLMLLGLLITIPLIVLATYLAQAALTVVVADRARGGTIDWQQVWGVVLQNLGSLLVTSILAAIGVAIGLVLCVVPGIIFGLLAALTVPVVLLEKKSGLGAIGRSVDLVRTDWVRVMVVLVVFACLQAVASWVGGLLIPSRYYFLHLLLGDLISIAILPIPIIGLVLLYQDILRSRLQLPEAQLQAQRDALLST